jgi:N-acetylated-alpha-linked acidic dipeptidase
MKHTAIAAALIVACAALDTASEQPPLRGFTTAESVTQREWEAKFRAIPAPENLREYMRVSSAEPHHAGSPGSRKVAEYILGRYKAWGLDAWIEEHEALMPFPVERRVELVAPERYQAKLQEPALSEDPDSTDAGQLPTYNAYSADGDVTARLVYVNYGTPEDYDELAKLGVDVKGAIVIARYGRSWRGIKPKVAAEHGAVACIIYSDPRDDGYFQGDVYPVGSWRPEHGVQRGSVMDMPLHPGDPLTPGWGSEKGGRKLDRSETKTLVRIPVLPVSYGDALPLLRHLRGPVAPVDWRGSLPITYHVGPGPARVRVALTFDWQVRPLYNVIARIPGSTHPDEWILHGNHHDAWVNGAQDPTSGNVALMETARSLGELVKQGWKPRRTIVFASWDGEEWGLLGSTEWAEKHAKELSDKAVVYINTDSTGKGWLGAGGSHSLEAIVSEVAREVPGPRSGTSSVFDEARERALETARTDVDRTRIRERPDLALEALGSGSDYTAFLDHLTIASLNLGFGGDDGGGIYHSIYDTFEWYRRFSDGDFVHGRALSQVTGTLIMRLAGATVLPFRFTDYPRTLSGYVDEIERDLKRQEGAPGLDLAPVRAAISKLAAAADSYERAVAPLTSLSTPGLASKADVLRRLNRLVYTSERALAHPTGLPRREWFRHLIYAPGFYTGYGVKTIPGIREGAEQKAWDEARSFVPIVAAAIERLAGQVEQASSLARAAGGKSRVSLRAAWRLLHGEPVGRP